MKCKEWELLVLLAILEITSFGETLHEQTHDVILRSVLDSYNRGIGVPSTIGEAHWASNLIHSGRPRGAAPFRQILRGGEDPNCLAVAGTPAMRALWEKAKRSPVGHHADAYMRSILLG